MDVQHLEFGDDTFDSALATFVFCSVPDARKGLGEIRRVVRPGGRIHLLEHMRSKTEWIARIMDLLDPITVRVLGPHINRRTVEAVRNAGLDLFEAKELDGFGIFRRIEARVPQAAPESAPIDG
jgi:ubiquinone/menaquinone biosynthesis C-methylase UbiE